MTDDVDSNTNMPLSSAKRALKKSPSQSKERRQDKKKLQGKDNKGLAQKIFYVIAILAWTFVGLIGAEFLVALIASLFLPYNVLVSPITNTIISIIAYLVAIGLLIYLPPVIFKDKFAKPTRERLGLMGLPTWTDIGLAIVGYVVTILLAAGLTVLFENFPWFNGSEAQDLGYNFYMQGFERGLAFMGLAVFAPIMEELIFRGWLYGKLRIKIPKVVAILLVSLLFGLVHFQWNVGITVFVMSVIACTLREVTGTIYAGTLMHMINNGVAFYLVYMLGMS